MQLVVDAASRDILCVSFCEWSRHDFQLFKDSRQPLLGTAEALADKGYTGLVKLPPNCGIPKKGTKNRRLTAEEQRSNAQLAKRRIGIEHINRFLKRFRILSSRYRNSTF